MSSKYRGAFLNILTCFSNKRKASNASLCRTTGPILSDCGHTDKEPSLRISKQSFDADSSLLDKCVKKNTYSNSKNHLSVPNKNGTAILVNDEHYRSRSDMNNMSFVRISPEGKIDDVIEEDECLSPERNLANSANSQNHNNSKITKVGLVINSAGKNHCVENVVELQNGISPCSDNVGQKLSCESQV